MERIHDERERGLTGAGLRIWGVLLLLLGTIGMGIVQNRLLGIGTLDGQSLLQLMEQSSSAMTLATIALVLQVAEACAVPFFAFLLAEGASHTASMKNYLIRVAMLALLCEIPYHLAIHGTVLTLDSRNPVFGVLLGLLMVYLYGYVGKVWQKICITIAAVIWCEMLGISHGSFLVILVATLWAMRGKPQYRLFVACAVCVLCSAISPFYLATPMSFVAIHLYNGNPGARNHMVNYLCYPVLLLAVFALSCMI